MKQVFKALVPVVLVSLLIVGCGGGIGEDKPTAEIKSEAQTMSLEQLKNIVAKYQKVIESKQAEINALKEKIKKIPVAQMLGDEAKKIKTDVENIANSVCALTERLNIYSRELRSKMR